jgi:hypothetical protein
MFEVCFDERSVSRLALVWLPDAQPTEPLSDSRAAHLLFTVLDRRDAVSAAAGPDKPGPDKPVPAKPARRPRKRDSVRNRNTRGRNARTQPVQTH